MRRGIRVLLVCTTVAAVAVASAGNAGAQPDLEPFAVPSGGFTIGVPDGWLAFDLTTTNQADVRRELDDAGADEARQLATEVSLLTQQGGQAYAVDPQRRAKFNQSLNVLRNPLLGRTLADFRAELRAPFENLGANAPKIREIQVDGVEALRSSGRVDYGGANVLLRQVVVVVGDAYLQVTISVRPGKAGKALAGAIVDSIDLA